jgi:uncharacterized protein involved in response to NO
MQAFLNHPFLGRGFRPFFLLGALCSVINLLIWGGFYAGMIAPPDVYLDAVSWHAHEMIYGFSTAIIAGFLLTAVANWTGGAPARQTHLAALCLVWFAGRVVMNFDLSLPPYAIFAIEGAFIPALAISLSIPLFKSWNKRNFVFLILLSTLFACDMTFLITEERLALYIAVMVIITMISLIGGRIIPAFTVAALRRRGEKAFQIPQNKLDIMALLSLLLIVLSLVFFGTEGTVLAIIAFVFGIIHIYRMRYYHTQKILNDPMVWILHAGYIWVIIGLFLMAAGALNLLPFSVALHALTAGAIGSMTLGMMCRVSLGHTGRNLSAGNLTIFSFVLMQAAAFCRVFGALIFPAYSNQWIVASALLWAVCFGVYIIIYAPMLLRARPDGKTA